MKHLNDPSLMYVLALMDDMRQGHQMGGVLKVKDWKNLSNMPSIEFSSWVEFGAGKSDRKNVDLSSGDVDLMQAAGWVQETGRQYAVRSYILTENGIRFFHKLKPLLSEIAEQEF